MVSYTIKNGSVVPPLTEKTDTYTAVSLEYKSSRCRATVTFRPDIM
jgi:hypothetical protein